jgi:ABC-type Na+ efflux pump permease subunit
MRILAVAWREFASTAMTKGFLIGAVIIPLISMAAIPLVIILVMHAKPPKVEGSVAVIDRTGLVLPLIRENLTPEAIARRQAEEQQRIQEIMARGAERFGASHKDVQRGSDMAKAMLPDVYRFEIKELPTGTDLKEAQAPMLRGTKDGGLLVLAVIDEDAVTRAQGEKDFGGFQLFVRPKLDERVIGEIRDSVRDAVRRTRIVANGMQPDAIQALTRVNESDTKEVTPEGERASSEAIAQILPIGFMILLVISVMVGGQYLVTTTIEEKSNRVVEVLLSAVSSKQLMTGKILGQMLVGLVLLVMYSGLGMGAMAAFTLMHLVEPMTVVYLVVFFVIAYFLIAATLASVGSAVNDLREAQSLQTPVMMCVMIPYLLWFPITRDPNSWFAIILSMVPPMSPFVMMLRITSTEPPPTWQVLLSIGIGFIAVYLAIWAAAKIFRVGLLMYGKPPNFRTLIRWVRMA